VFRPNIEQRARSRFAPTSTAIPPRGTSSARTASSGSPVRASRQSLPRLSPEHREVIDLAYYHGKSVKEIAEIVSISEATVKTRMFYARRKLAELLETT
jgi:RNA polymerase sigma-70 factor (ECF subfamily)